MAIRLVVRSVLVALVGLPLLGCPSVRRDIQTPFGPVPGEVFEDLEVLGVINRTFQTGNLPDGRRKFEESFTLDVPVGTYVIVPAVRGWSMGFGETEPELIGPDSEFEFHPDERKLGFQHVAFHVDRIYAADTSVSPPRQQAEVRIGMLLTERDHNRRWFGLVTYTLICLGRSEEP